MLDRAKAGVSSPGHDPTRSARYPRVVARRLPMFLLRMDHGYSEGGATDIAAYRSIFNPAQ